GALAAFQRGLTDIDIRFLEAQPQHFHWLTEAIAINGLEGSNLRLIEGALSYAEGPVSFRANAEGYTAATWYGQEISPTPTTATDRTYFGKPVSTDGRDEYIPVDPVTLECVLDRAGIVDLIDADLQGSEKELVEYAL